MPRISAALAPEGPRKYGTHLRTEVLELSAARRKPTDPCYKLAVEGSTNGGPSRQEPARGTCRVCRAQLPSGTPRFCPHCGSSCALDSADADIGTVICQRYRLVRLLGEGSSGRVYEASQTVGRAERRVAVKVLLLAHLYNPKVVQRLTREIEIASSLMHPSTIRVYDFGELVDGRPFVVMEFVDGVSLGNLLLQHGPLDLKRACGLMSQVCGSLAEAHERGIVHRDLKPDNLMVMSVGGQPDLVKVLDFGVAKQAPLERGSQTPITEEGALVGTPQYMSPEQFSGSDLTSASDIYALGIVAYEMLVGRPPFEATELIAWAACHMTETPPPFETTQAGAGVPDTARRAVLRALSKDPRERQQTAVEFYAELSSALGTLRASGARPSTLQGNRPPIAEPPPCRSANPRCRPCMGAQRQRRRCVVSETTRRCVGPSEFCSCCSQPPESGPLWSGRGTREECLLRYFLRRL